MQAANRDGYARKEKGKADNKIQQWIPRANSATTSDTTFTRNENSAKYQYSARGARPLNWKYRRKHISTELAKVRCLVSSCAYDIVDPFGANLAILPRIAH